MPAISQENISINDIIFSGNADWPTDYTQAKFREIFVSLNQTFPTLNSIQFTHLINYLIIFTQTPGNSTHLDKNDLNNLLKFIHKGLTRIKTFDENGLKALKRLIDLFKNLTTVQKNLYNLIYDIETVSRQFAPYLGKMLKEAPRDSRYYSHDFLNPYLLGIRSLIDNKNFLNYCHIEDILDTLNNLAKDCLSVDHCNHSARLIQISNIFGEIAHNLGPNHGSFQNIMNDTIVLIIQTSNTNRLTSNQIKELAYEFSRSLYSGQNFEFINTKCAEIFKLPDCDFFSNQATLSTTALISNTTTPNPSISDINNPTLTTNDNPATTQPSNQAVVSTTNLQSAGYVGIAMGAKDIVIKALRDVCVNSAKSRNCSRLAINSIETFFWLINTVTTAATPLLIAYATNTLQYLEDEENITITSQLIISSTLCFSLEALSATSFFLQKNTHIKKILGYIKPFIIFLGLIANEDVKEGFTIYGITATGGTIGSIGTRVLMQKAKTFFFCKEKNKIASENDIALLPISLRDKSIPRNSNGSNTSSNNSSLPDPTKFCYFIEPMQFEKLKADFNLLITILGYLLEDYDSIISNLTAANQLNKELSSKISHNMGKKAGIEKERSTLVSIQLCLNENKHEEACKRFETAYEMIKDESIKQLQGVFILLKRILAEETIRNLNQIKGYDQGNTDYLPNQDDETLRNASVPAKLKFVVQTAHQLSTTLQGVFTNYDKKEAGCNQNNLVTPFFDKTIPNRRLTLSTGTPDELQSLTNNVVSKIK